MAPLSLETIGDVEGLSALEVQWWDLWRRTPGATPFQSPAWLIAWGRQFAPGALRVAVARQSGRLMGMFPFYREAGADGDRLLPLGVSLSDYLDVLVDPAAPGAAPAMVAFMSEGRWKQWRLEEMPPGSIAAGLPRPLGCMESWTQQSACPVLTLSGGADLSACVPTRRRRQLRRAWSAAARLGQIALTREQDSERFLAILFMLHAARWRSRQEGGVLADAAVQKFHRAALAHLAAAQLARCYVLTIAHRPAAAYYGFCAGGRSFAYIGGFDPAFEEASPGAMLIGHSIAEAIREGAHEFHFLRGREAYKYTWGASDRWNRRRVWTRPSDG